ncbi:hypothetical protein AC579_4400 [Pseudocercospora musae]|uniref:Uncharacterized protein n=1 Tax=Pseudocercospora musae TaxID=113226 RepID=A0A139IJX7_9PEZI|nr:hypothetical protein AC579_4400 [Pseudocercospora musae]
MPLFLWSNAATEAKRLQQRSIDFDRLQDQTKWNRDRVTRFRRSVCPSPESKPACSMSGFVANNRAQQETKDQTATVPPK